MLCLVSLHVCQIIDRSGLGYSSRLLEIKLHGSGVGYSTHLYLINLHSSELSTVLIYFKLNDSVVELSPVLVSNHLRVSQSSVARVAFHPRWEDNEPPSGQQQSLAPRACKSLIESSSAIIYRLTTGESLKGKWLTC